ncbi:MAG: TlpA family protein disulfide reductase [Bdellovibrionales bacterium]|nr:TlpA family protein disulfide reductase [Bdellovibrionales bacterium]
MLRGILACGFAFLTVQTQALPELRMGSTAPKLRVEQWLKGPEIKEFEPGHVYVVEFWGTWCGPCVDSIPHLNELQAKYGSRLTVIGIASSEQGTREEQISGLAKFLESTEMGYAVAFDSTGWMKEKWLKASAAPGIPRAMVVNGSGTILFIGHPMDLDEPELGNPLEQIVNGTWESSADYKQYAEREKLAFEAEEKATSLLPQVQEARAAAEWKNMIRVAEEGLALNTPMADALFAKYLIEALIQDGQHEQGQSLIEARIRNNFDHVQVLANILEMIIHPAISSEKWDLKLGDEAAERAVDLTENHSDPQLREKFLKYRWILLPPVAEYYAKTNRLSLAVQLQKRALTSVDTDDTENWKKLEDQLKSYEAKAHPVECTGGVCQIPAFAASNSCVSNLKGN